MKLKWRSKPASNLVESQKRSSWQWSWGHITWHSLQRMSRSPIRPLEHGQSIDQRLLQTRLGQQRGFPTIVTLSLLPVALSRLLRHSYTTSWVRRHQLVIIQPCNAIHPFWPQQALIFLNCHHCHHLDMILQRHVQLSSSNQPVPCPQQLSLHLNFTWDQIWCHHTFLFYLPNHLIPKPSQKEHLWRQWDLSDRWLMAWRGRMWWRTTKYSPCLPN